VRPEVLPEALAADPQFRERFEREAKTISQLNHPHICTLHDLGRDGGVDYLVMEFVEGESLDEKIRRCRLSIDEALPIARQIASALDAAHEKGIVHRDLKPANIKVTPDGSVKVLDFGLAKSAIVAHGFQGGSQLSMSPTVFAGATQAGVILGTAAYMSPEQARGLPVDKRADIWAFGCVLYEMLTARQAFSGATATDIIAAIVREEPAWDALPRETPATVRRLLRRCLEKDPRQRWRDIGDARIELEAPVAADEPSAPAPAMVPRTAWSWVAAAVFALTTLALAGLQLLKPASPDRPVVRFMVPPPERATLGHESELLWPCRPMGCVWLSTPRLTAGNGSGCVRSIRPIPSRSPTPTMPIPPSGRLTAAIWGSSHKAG
jgi:serine/threonine protein kinase